MTLTNYVATKALFEALIRAKRGLPPPAGSTSSVPARDASPSGRANAGAYRTVS